MASSSRTDWAVLAQLRKRGQRPIGTIFVTDHYGQRRNLESSGGFAVFPPSEGEAYLVSGLDVLFIADRSDRSTELAQSLASAGPRCLWVHFRGSNPQQVIP
jgi:hypothetical protein